MVGNTSHTSCFRDVYNANKGTGYILQKTECCRLQKQEDTKSCEGFPIIWLNQCNKTDYPPADGDVAVINNAMEITCLQALSRWPQECYKQSQGNSFPQQMAIRLLKQSQENSRLPQGCSQQMTKMQPQIQ